MELARRIGKTKVFKGLSLAMSISDEASAAAAEATRKAFERQASLASPVIKVSKPVNYVGPRPKFQFDRRGRRTY